MRNVLPTRLWIANAIQARDVRSVLSYGIAAVVDLALEELPIQFPRDIVYCRMPLLDGAGNPPPILRTAIAVTRELIQGDVPTLVACSAGMSRSPTIVAAALASIRGTPFWETLVEITAGQPADISPALTQSIAEALETSG